MVESDGGGFDDRVKALKHSWEETHFLVTLAGRKDRRSQSALLEAMYQWCQESVLTIQAIYGSALKFEVTPGLDSVSAELGFTVALRGGEALVAWLEESPARAGEWRVSLFTRSADPRNGLTPIRPPRGRRSWTRSSVEGALLALVAGYERGRNAPALEGRDSLFALIRKESAHAGTACCDSKELIMMTSLSDLTRASAPPSLLAAAVELHRVIEACEAGSIAGLREALRQAMASVEQELGGASGGPSTLPATDPRFRFAIERLEAGLGETLVLLWETRLSEPGVAPSPALFAAARKLRRLADQALDLLHQSMQPIGGRD